MNAAKEPAIPDRWANTAGSLMCFAGFLFTLMAAPDGTANVSLAACVDVLFAVGLLIPGMRLLRRDRW